MDLPHSGTQGVKAVGKFATYAALGNPGWRLNDWDSWRQQDGLMCRWAALVCLDDLVL